MSESATVVMQGIETKSGEKNGRSWTSYRLKDANGVIYSTFQKAVIDPVSGAAGQKVDIEFEINGQFKNLLRAEIHNNGSSVPPEYSHQREDGEADWDKVALGKTRCALWNHFLSGHLAANLYAKAVAENAKLEKPGDAMDYVIITGTRLVVHAEKDVFERPPGDDGIPFDPNGIEI